MRLGSLLRAAICCSALLFASTVAAQAEAPFRVIVHSTNPVASLTRSELSRLFLKKTVAWTSGEVLPVDLGEDSEVRQVFSKRVLGKDVASVKGYWQQLIFTGRGVPPVEKASEADVLSFVATNRNAIGYISSTTPLGAGVKVVRITG